MEPKEISDWQHEEFYRYVAQAYDKPRYTLHYRADAPLNIRSIFYVPEAVRSISQCKLYFSCCLVAKLCKNLHLGNQLVFRSSTDRWRKRTLYKLFFSDLSAVLSRGSRFPVKCVTKECICQQKPSMFDVSREMGSSVALYSRKVLIQTKATDILPKWLRFLRGLFLLECF